MTELNSKIKDEPRTRSEEPKLNGRMTITEIADRVGVTPKTIMRWEKAGKIQKPKRDWKGWRFYEDTDLAVIQQIVSSVYEL